jgi:hypothetical protein
MGTGSTGARAVDEDPGRLLTLGRVDRLRIQVGYRADPDVPARLQFLLDLPVPEAERELLDEAAVLVALEPVLRVGGGPPGHYSLHQHRWHTTWGPSPGTLDLGLLVTTDVGTPDASAAADTVVADAFRALMRLVGTPDPSPT